MSAQTEIPTPSPPVPPDEHAGEDAPRIVPVRRTGQWAAAVVVLLLLAGALVSVVRNDAFQWDVVGAYLTTDSVLRGLGLTLWLTGLVMVLGFALGTLLAVFRLSSNRVLQAVSWGYVWLFRSTPILVQLLFWFNIGALYPQILGVNTVNLLSPIAVAVIGLTLHEAAYAAEVIRGGILSVERGQVEAAQSLGLGPWRQAPAGRAAPGDALHRAARGEHADRHLEGHLDRQHHRRAGPAVLRAARLPPHLRGHPAPAGRHPLVRRDHLAAVHRPALRGTPLRTRHGRCQMSDTPTLVVIGGGPRGTGVIERIAVNAAELYGDRPLDIHIVDPYPPGGGRIWRQEQSPLLWMNSMAEDVTMFTDDTVQLDGPVNPGPALHTWAADVREGRTTATADPEVLAEIHGLQNQGFPSRRLQSAYLRWVYEQAVAALPPGITVHEHTGHALRVSGTRDGRQRIHLQGRAEPLDADLVVLTVGHLDSEPEPEQQELASFAARHGLVHLPPDFTADTDLSAVPAGESVLVRGFGLAFIDLMVLLTEGAADGTRTGSTSPPAGSPSCTSDRGEASRTTPRSATPGRANGRPCPATSAPTRSRRS